MPEIMTDKPARKQPHAQYEMAKKAQGAIGRLGDAPQPDPLHRRPAVEAMTGLSRSTIYAKLDARGPHYDPEFPKPVRLGQRAVAWRESELVAWMNSREQVAEEWGAA